MEIGSRPFIIAEMSGNHNGDLATALALIAAASNAGCDAVKIQLYQPQDLGDPANNDIYEKYQIPTDWLYYLFEKARDCKIPLFSSVFARWAIEFLEEVDCPAYKLASPESTRLPEIEYMRLAKRIRDTGQMFLASSGRRDMLMMRALHPDVLFYCVAGYPATVTDDDLSYLSHMPLPRPGFSDHSNDIKTPLAMIAAGAKVIEKHFKLDDNCCDAAFSLNPEQMAELCRIAHR